MLQTTFSDTFFIFFSFKLFKRTVKATFLSLKNNKIKRMSSGAVLMTLQRLTLNALGKVVADDIFIIIFERQ